jgi:hypothetical protein
MSQTETDPHDFGQELNKREFVLCLDQYLLVWAEERSTPANR